ncbi:MAG: hypothetical protein WDM96_07155 [Lacunisphaera sp.]
MISRLPQEIDSEEQRRPADINIGSLPPFWASMSPAVETLDRHLDVYAPIVGVRVINTAINRITIGHIDVLFGDGVPGARVFWHLLEVICQSDHYCGCNDLISVHMR